MPGFRKSGGRSFGGGGGGYNRGGGGGYGGNRNRDRGQVVMSKAVCDECGEECEVPFKPTGDRPVYCNACFGGKKETVVRPAAGGGAREFGGARESGNDLKKQLEMLNGKMDVLITIIESMANLNRSIASEKDRKPEKTVVKSVVKRQIKKALAKK